MRPVRRKVQVGGIDMISSFRWFSGKVRSAVNGDRLAEWQQQLDSEIDRLTSNRNLSSDTLNTRSRTLTARGV